MSKLLKAAPVVDLYDPTDTHACTDPFYRFIVEYDHIVGLFLFITSSAARMDEMQAIAARAIARALGDEKEREKPVDAFNKGAALGFGNTPIC
jgi:hypothetical protein